MYFKKKQKRKQIWVLEIKYYNVVQDGEKRHVKNPNVLKIQGELISTCRCLNPKLNLLLLESLLFLRLSLVTDISIEFLDGG